MFKRLRFRAQAWIASAPRCLVQNMAAVEGDAGGAGAALSLANFKSIRPLIFEYIYICIVSI